MRTTIAMACIFVCSLPVLSQPASQPGHPGVDEVAPLPEEQREPVEPGRKGGGPDKSESAVEGIVEKASVTQHELPLTDGVLRYSATAANMLMKDEDGKLKARVFFVAYEKEHPADADPADRPITFVFNGGPGAAAVWLHLGTAGPKRIDLAPDGEPLPPPHRLVDNAFTWLDATDLVFIDPVGTGFSRPEKGEATSQFYGVREDITWVADFIRLYSSHYQRWLSPRFLAGESYGTTRAAGLSQHLLDRHGLSLNGIILISSVLHFQTLSPGDANDLPYALYLPTCTAVAWYHRRLPDDLQGDLSRTLEQVERFCVGDYLVALARGSALSPETRAGLVERLARFTGLPAELIDRSNLRISPSLFQKHLLAGDMKVVGRFDARITGHDLQPVGDHPAHDPSFTGYLPVYSATFNDYVRRSLKYDSVLPYEVLSPRVGPWRYGTEGRGYLSVADSLRIAMVKNPHLKVIFCSGYYDMATPYYATTYTIDHLDLPRELRANIRETHYHAGHMMYHNRPDLEKLHADLSAFIRWAISAAAAPQP